MLSELAQTALLLAMIFGGEYGLWVRPMMIVKDVIFNVPVTPENLLETGVVFVITFLFEALLILMLQERPVTEEG